jgi:DNA-binding response OmpR family regulator
VKILVAEDDPVSRRLLEVTLSKWGYEVVTCADGQAAWDALKAPDAPQLVILDWMMPLLDGLQVCRNVRNPAERPAEPYV